MKVYLSCVDCGKPKDTLHARKAPRCHTCENKRRAHPVEEFKICKSCQTKKPLADFYLRQNFCKACSVQKSLSWNRRNKEAKNHNNKKSRLKNLEKVRAWDRRYYAQHKAERLSYVQKWRKENQDKIKEGKRRWYAENFEKSKKSKKLYYQANREKTISDAKKWRERNPDKVKVNHTKRRALLNNSMSTLNAHEWKEIKKSYGNQCVYCGVKATTLDHIVPISKGGDNTRDNIVPACRSCNSSKQEKSLLVFMLHRLIYE